MQTLGMTALDTTVFISQEMETVADRLANWEQVNMHAGMAPEQARQMALVRYLHAYTEALLEANNRKIAADLIRLGVLMGTIKPDGEPTF